MVILRLSSVLEQTGFRSHSSIYRAINAGEFPAPVRIGRRAVGWPLIEVQAINAARVAAVSSEQLRELVNHLYVARAGWMARLGMTLASGSSFTDLGGAFSEAEEEVAYEA